MVNGIEGSVFLFLALVTYLHIKPASSSSTKPRPVEDGGNAASLTMLSMFFFFITAALGGGCGVALIFIPEQILVPTLLRTTIEQIGKVGLRRAAEASRTLGPFLTSEGLFAISAFSIRDKK